MQRHVASIALSTALLGSCTGDSPGGDKAASATAGDAGSGSASAPRRNDGVPVTSGGASGARAPETGAAGSAAAAAGGNDTSAAPVDSSAEGTTVGEGPLPDLVLDAAYLIDTIARDIVQTDDMCLMKEGCVTGLGERRVIRFGSRTGNIGNADFLLGKPEAGNPYWTYDACHDSYDLAGFAFYELFDANTGARVVTGAKNAFCLRDSEPWALEGGPFCGSYDCVGQGIGQGCADNYGSELQCQWVDITGLPPGVYTLRVTINANRDIAELDYGNNVVNVAVEILDDAVLVSR
jgi:hypothetical protein